MPLLSPLLDRFEPSPISQLFDRAARLKSQGRDLWDFSTGEPDFDTPEPIRHAGMSAIEAGDTRYTPVGGTGALKDAIARKFARDNELVFAPDQIIVGAGAKPVIAAAIQAVAASGDDVILTAPCWPSHAGMIGLAGASMVQVPVGKDTGFKLTPQLLARAITPSTRLLILCSPSNPTGAVFSAAELRALADVLLAHPDIWILSDDLYEHIVFDGVRFATLAQVAPGLAERTLTVNGVSKAYAMTGWRIGFAGGPRRWIEAIGKIFTQSSGGPCSISQAAAIAALDGSQDFLAERAEIYQNRRDLALAGLSGAPGLECATPQGAFYLLPDCAGVLGKTTPDGTVIRTSADFADYLFSGWDVVVIPGAGFDCDPYFRMTIATSETIIEAGTARIRQACEALE